jgi:H+/gluconate symporter-like permease
MSDMGIIVNTAVAILAVVVLIVRFKFNPVVSLVVGSAYLGLATGLGVEKTIESITTGFGEIMTEVGLLIAFGVLMGAILQRTGAIQRLVQTLLKVFGAKRMPYAMSLTIATFLQSIFLDVLLVISAPLARTLAKKIGRNGVGRMAAAMAIGLECGIVLTVPGVGALALAGLLGVPLGKMLLFGVMLVIPTVAIAVAIMSFLFNHGWWNEERDEQEFLGADPDLDEEDDEIAGRATGSDDAGTPDGGGVATKVATAQSRPKTAPAQTHVQPAPAQTHVQPAPAQTHPKAPLILLFAPLLASLVLIATGAILDAAEIENPIVKFVSSPVIALLIGLVGTSFVGRYALGAQPIQDAIATGFKESGQILILTGVGGSLAATIKATGLGDILGEYFTASTAAPLLMVWAIAAVLHIAVGSVTISAITSAGILAPVAPLIGIDPVMIALAAGAGSLFAVHVTSNTFWLLQSLLGQTTRGTLKTVTVGVSVASVVAILLILPMSALL